MFDIGPSELLLIVIVAVVVIGPKDLPLALRTAGKWIGKVRRVSGHFRSGIETMIREAEMAEMEKKWREQNERIMQEHPQGAPAGEEQTGAWPAAAAPVAAPNATGATAESRVAAAGAPENLVPDAYADAPHLKPQDAAPAPAAAPAAAPAPAPTDAAAPDKGAA